MCIEESFLICVHPFQWRERWIYETKKIKMKKPSWFVCFYLIWIHWAWADLWPTRSYPASRDTWIWAQIPPPPSVGWVSAQLKPGFPSKPPLCWSGSRQASQNYLPFFLRSSHPPASLSCWEQQWPEGGAVSVGRLHISFSWLWEPQNHACGEALWLANPGTMWLAGALHLCVGARIISQPAPSVIHHNLIPLPWGTFKLSNV